MPNRSHWRNIFLLVATGLLAAGCASSTPVEDAPLDDDEERELREALPGTWEQTHRVVGDKRKPMRTSRGIWTFREDGTGEFQQMGGRAGVAPSRMFEWSLEGRNIRLDMMTGGGDATYRADEWDADKMEWFDYARSDHYIVEKI